MIKAWLSKRRFNKLLALPDNEERVPVIGRPDTYSNAYLLEGPEGPMAFLTPEMEYVPADAFYLSQGKCANWCPRFRIWDDKCFDEMQAIVNYLKMCKLSWKVGIPYLVKDGDTYCLALNSINPDSVTFFGPKGIYMRIPMAAFGDIPKDWFLRAHIYTAIPVDLVTQKPVEDWIPIIQAIPSKGSVKSAYTSLAEVTGCPGLLDFNTMDIVININRLDSSSLPIVDLAPFIKAIRDGITHVTKRWTLNIDQIQLNIGMNPKPIAVCDLAAELPDHRIILSDTPSRYSQETYDNAYTLPKTYP